MRQLTPVSEQLALFSDDAAAPRGLRYQPGFITAQSEQELIAQIRALPLAPFQFGAFEGKRRVASFGWRHDYNQHKLEQAEDPPAWIAPLIVKVQAFAGLPAASIRQVLFTEYEKGTGIGWHRDKPHFDQVFGLSLASTCKFRFRRKSGRTWRRFTLEAEPRSLYMMAGDSRSIWEHSISPVYSPRYSITFRTMAGENTPASRPPGQIAR